MVRAARTKPPVGRSRARGPCRHAYQLASKLGSSVKPNRSIPSATVIPVLIYPDVRAAVDWLGKAFGFVERVQIGEDHRAQLSFGDGAIIVGDVRHDRRPPRPNEVTHSVMVRVDDVD